MLNKDKMIETEEELELWERMERLKLAKVETKYFEDSFLSSTESWQEAAYTDKIKCVNELVTTLIIDASFLSPDLSLADYDVIYIVGDGANSYVTDAWCDALRAAGKVVNWLDGAGYDDLGKNKGNYMLSIDNAIDNAIDNEVFGDLVSWLESLK